MSELTDRLKNKYQNTEINTLPKASKINTEIARRAVERPVEKINPISKASITPFPVVQVPTNEPVQYKSDLLSNVVNTPIKTLPKGAKEYKEPKTPGGKALSTIGGITGNLLVGATDIGPSALKYTDNALKTTINNISNLYDVLPYSNKYKIPGKILNYAIANLNPIAQANKQVNTEEYEKWKQNTTQENIDKSYGVGKYISELAPSLGSNAVNALISAYNPVLGTAMFMSSAGGNYLDEAKARGMTDNQAFIYASIMGALEGGTEKVVSGDAMKWLAKKAGVKKLTQEALEELTKKYGFTILENALQEGVTEPINEGVAQIVAGKGNNENLWQRSLQSALGGAVSGGLMGAGSMAFGKTAGAINNKIEEARAYNDQNRLTTKLKQEAIDAIQKSKLSSQEKQQYINAYQNAQTLSQQDVDGLMQGIQLYEQEQQAEQNRINADKKKRQDYMKYKNDTKEYDSSVVNEVNNVYTTNRNGKRTVKQWLTMAEDIGSRISNKTDAEIERIAYKSWFDLEPSKSITRYDNVNKTNVAFQKLSADEWTKAIIDSANKNRQTQEVLPVTNENNRVLRGAKENLNEIEGFQVEKDYAPYDKVLGNSFKIKTQNGEAKIVMRETADSVYLNNIITRNTPNQTEKGTGTKIMNKLKEYCDKTNKKFVLVEGVSSADGFYDKFDWLKKENVEVYDDDGKLFETNTEKNRVYYPNEVDKTNQDSFSYEHKILNNYDENTKNRIEQTGRDIVIQSNEQLESLVDEAFNEKTNKALHLGRINNEIVNKIKSQIMNLPNNVNILSNDTYDLIINQSEIRHLLDNKNGLNIDDVKHFLDILPEIITDSDHVAYSKNNKYEGIKFKKVFNDGTYASFVITSKKRTMKVQTIYMEKGDYENKKRSISLPNDATTVAPNNTFETSKLSTSINNIISQNDQNMQENSENVSDNELKTGKYTEQQENKKQRETMNPSEISNMNKEEASTTPKLENKKYGRGNKESSFYENITEDSKFLNSDLREEMAKDPNIKYYKGITNKETLEKSFNNLKQNGSKAVLDWYSKDTNNATVEDVTTGWILLKQYQDANDYESAINVAKKMREIGTKAGQTVQAYNIMSRLTPEGMFYYAQSELTEAYNKLVEGKTKKWIDENAKNFELTPEDTEFIKETMKEVAEMEDGYEKKVKLAQIQKRLTDKLPTTLSKEIKAWMRISMLFNPKTQVRNVMGNAVVLPVNAVGDIIASKVDKVISKKTGVRTTGTTDISSYSKGFKKGLYESYNDFKLGINTRNIEGNRFEVTEGNSFNNNTKIGKALNATDKMLSFMLDAGDRGFYEASFTNSINNQLVLNNATEVTQDMIDIATQEALQRTWQDDNNYTKAVLDIRKILNKVNVKGYGLGDVIIPFAKTPANLTKAIVDYSPVGLVNSLRQGIALKNSLETGQYTAIKQHEFVQNLGKATAGTFLYVLGYALAKAGIASGEPDDDKDVKNFMKNSLGISSYSIKIGNKTFTYDWAQPVATPLAIMTNYVKYSEDNPDANAIEKGIKAMNIGTEQLLEQSFMESLNTVLNGNGTTLENLSKAVLDLPARAVPTMFKQVADMVDGTQRTSFEYDKPVESAINSVKSKIPFASMTLAPSYDTLGNEIKKYGGENNLFNVFLNPANVNKGELSKSGEEIYKVYQQTGDKTIFPRVAPYYINSGGEKINMDSRTRSKFQKVSGDYVEKSLDSLLTQNSYKNLNYDEKAKMINEIVSDSYNKAKKDVLGIANKTYDKLENTLKTVKEKTYYDYKVKTTGMTKDSEKINVLINSNYSAKETQAIYENYILDASDKKYDVIKTMGLNINEYLKYKVADTTSKDKAFNAVEGLKGTYIQKLALFALSYKVSEQEKKTLFNYVNSLQLTKAQKEELFNKFK